MNGFNNALPKLLQRDKRFVKVYANMLIKGNVNWEVLGRIYRPDDKNPIWKAKQTVKRIEIQEMTADALVDITSGVVTAKQALKYRLSVLKGAIARHDFKAANTALDAFDGKLGLNPVVVKGSFSAKGSFIDYKAILEANELKQIEQGNETE